jgi:hypothetical protein
MMLAALAWLVRPRTARARWDRLTVTEVEQRARELWRQP